MSALLPISPGQIARWSRPRPEPVTLTLPDWRVTVTEPSATFPNQRWTTFEKDGARVQLMRYWDQPRSPGYPMETASKRDVVVAGRPIELATTRVFDGQPKSVEVLWLKGKGYDVRYGVRLVCEGCDERTLADVLARLVVCW